MAAALLQFIDGQTGRTLGSADVSKYITGPTSDAIATSPDARCE